MVLDPDRIPSAVESAAVDTTRDRLAADRTAMANERTFLAYVRTSLALILTGASAVHLPGLHPRLAFEASAYYIVGGGFIAFGFAVLLIGYLRYRRFRERIRSVGAASHS